MLPWLRSGNVYLWQFILHHFQQLDIASLPLGVLVFNKGFMCNGANFVYQILFQELNGFHGNDTIASGDDVFLLQKQLQFLKSKYLKFK
jgi:hypothetical protein